MTVPANYGTEYTMADLRNTYHIDLHKSITFLA